MAGNRAYYLGVLAMFAVTALMVRNLRRGRTGLALEAMHESPVGVASLGTSVQRLKFAVFCVSAFIAGLGGAMLAGSIELATPFNFFEVQSLVILALAVVGGIASWPGALVGAILLQLTAPFLHQPMVSQSFVGRVIFRGQLEALLPVLFGLGAIGLARNPHGIVAQVRQGLAWAIEVVRAIRARWIAPAESSQTVAHIETTPAGRALPPDAPLVSFPAARWVHRPDCVLTTGKDDVLNPGDLTSLTPCPVCRPDLGLAPA
jgi:branched-chain amino acid transport system permease protein